MKNSGDTLTRFVCLLTLISITIFGAAASAQSCGSPISTDTVLTSDIGPCPFEGLYAWGKITVNLNGHTIRGTGANNSFMHAGIIAESGVKIIGPGEITGFTVGVWVDSGSATTPVVITGLRLTRNKLGVSLSEGSQFTRVVDNIITKGVIGVSVVASGAEIKGNFITRNSQQGITVLEPGWPAVLLLNNFVTDNSHGLTVNSSTDPDYNGRVSVAGNSFSRNTSGGVSLTGVNVEFEANLVEHNGGDGIVLTDHHASNSAFSLLPGDLILDNIVRKNRGNGISVLNSDATNSNILVRNESKKNRGFDLLWDGIGTTSCWVHNDFDTSSPATLPCS